MLLSKSHQFIFIHVPKVAGNSIEKIFGPYSHKNADINKRPVNQHIWAVKLREELPGDIYGGYFKFAFVRNPWDRWVSLYFYFLQNPGNQFHKTTKSYRDFEHFLENEVTRIHRPQQKKFVTDQEGKLIVDFVGKLETLSQDIGLLCERLNIPPPSSSVPRLNPSRHDHYTSYYNPRTRQLVEEHSKDDIRLFGYTFDGSIPGRV